MRSLLSLFVLLAAFISTPVWAEDLQAGDQAFYLQDGGGRLLVGVIATAGTRVFVEPLGGSRFLPASHWTISSRLEKAAPATGFARVDQDSDWLGKITFETAQAYYLQFENGPDLDTIDQWVAKSRVQVATEGEEFFFRFDRSRGTDVLVKSKFATESARFVEVLGGSTAAVADQWTALSRLDLAEADGRFALYNTPTGGDAYVEVLFTTDTQAYVRRVSGGRPFADRWVGLSRVTYVD